MRYKAHIVKQYKFDLFNARIVSRPILAGLNGTVSVFVGHIDEDAKKEDARLYLL